MADARFGKSRNAMVPLVASTSQTLFITPATTPNRDVLVFEVLVIASSASSENNAKEHGPIAALMDA